MSTCSSPVSASLLSLPESLLTSSSLLINFASPPFSFLPLSPPNSGELFAFDQLPLLLQGVSSPGFDNRNQARSSGGSLSSCSSDQSHSSNRMSASDSLRQSISSTASSSLRSISEGSIMKPVEIYAKNSGNEYFLEVAQQKEEDFSLVTAGTREWQGRQSDEIPPSSLFERLGPLVRTMSMLSIDSRRHRQKQRERGSNTSSSPSVKVVIKREQTMTSQSVDRGDCESYQYYFSQTAAWRMMQTDCRADQIFGDISSILSHAPFATSCISPTSPTYRHCDNPSSSPIKSNLIQSHVSRTTSHSDSRANKKKGLAIGSLVLRLRKKGCKGSQAFIRAASPEALSVASEEELSKATRILGISWGCDARKIWNADCGQRSCNSYVQPEITTESSLEKVEVEGWTLEPDESHLQQWSAFYQAYSQGQIDLSVTPKLPRGVPEFEFCPLATPAGPGCLEAPTPDWEIQRARVYCRLELHRLTEQTLKVIAEKVASCLLALHVQQSVLHYLQGDTVLRLTANGSQEEDERRQQCLCAHAILNQNRGMVIQDLAKDWRFEKSERKGFNYYAGMPIVAANGLPIAILSVWDKQKDFNIEPHFLKRMAREIGQIFEEHYRNRWESKVCQMTKSVEVLQNRLDQGINVPWSYAGETWSKSTSYNFNDLEALNEMDILVSLEDVNRLQWTLCEMSSLIDMEVMYIAAVPLEGEEKSKQRVFLLAQVNLDDDSLSNQFHQTLFQLHNKAAINKDFVLHQNDCMTRQCSAIPSDSQPLLGANTGLEAMLILPVAQKRKVGFVLGALTRSKTKVIGIEDLRYLEALRPSLCAAVDGFISAAHQTLHSKMGLTKATEWN